MAGDERCVDCKRKYTLLGQAADRLIPAYHSCKPPPQYVRMRATFVVEYEVDPKAYGGDVITTTEMALIDQKTAAEDPSMWLDGIDDGEPIRVTVEPA